MSSNDKRCDKKAWAKSGDKVVIKSSNGEQSFIAEEPLTFYQAMNRIRRP